MNHIFKTNLMDNNSSRGAWKIIIAILVINIGIFVLNLYVSNHWLYGQPLSLKLIREIGFSMFWMPDGYETVSELLMYGPFYNLGITHFGLSTDAVMNGETYRLFTHFLFHADVIHLASNMIALSYISFMHFLRYGKREYFTWYLAGGFGGGLAVLAWAAIIHTDIMAIGASSAIFGLLGGSLAPIVYAVVLVKGNGGSFRAADRRTMFEYVAFVLVMLIPGFFEEGVSWGGHLGGLLGGLIAGIVMLWIKYRGGEMPERKAIERKPLNFGRKGNQQTHTYTAENGTSYVVSERQEELDKDKLEKRKRIGMVVLILAMVITVLVIISNLKAALDYEAMNIDAIYRAWHLNLLWCVIGWIPNVVAHRFLRGAGKLYTILIVIAWILWLLVGPTGIGNPIPQSV